MRGDSIKVFQFIKLGDLEEMDFNMEQHFKLIKTRFNRERGKNTLQ